MQLPGVKFSTQYIPHKYCKYTASTDYADSVLDFLSFVFEVGLLYLQLVQKVQLLAML